MRAAAGPTAIAPPFLELGAESFLAVLAELLILPIEVLQVPVAKRVVMLVMVLATAFPGIMPFLLAQLVNGSLVTTVLRLRAAHRELKAQPADVVPITRPITVPVRLTGAAA